MFKGEFIFEYPTNHACTKYCTFLNMGTSRPPEPAAWLLLPSADSQLTLVGHCYLLLHPADLRCLPLGLQYLPLTCTDSRCLPLAPTTCFCLSLTYCALSRVLVDDPKLLEIGCSEPWALLPPDHLLLCSRGFRQVIQGTRRSALVKGRS